jgi:2-polyprenyl-3-methyl-5-hydroxy-6-metoxy-1,4-benzoquinol methylase
MIICPECTEPYQTNWVCKKCHHEIEVNAGIPFFSPLNIKDFKDHSIHGLEEIYNNQSSHFWLTTRNTFIGNHLKKHLNLNQKCMEIGGGTGNVANHLQKLGFDISVGEIQAAGIKMAQKLGIKNIYQFDIYSPVFKEEFHAIGVFDVLEHLEKDKLALDNIHFMLKPKGKVFITVPAHKWLWNYRDILEKHKRRYELKELKKLVQSSGFNIIEAKHFFVFITPLLYLRTFFKNDSSNQNDQELKDDLKINPFINFILKVLTTLENFLLAPFSPKVGGSILIIAEKRE